MAAMLEGYVDKLVQIVTNDGRNIVGLLKGFDQTTNVILDECHERVFSSTNGVEQARRTASVTSHASPPATEPPSPHAAGGAGAVYRARRQHVRDAPPPPHSRLGLPARARARAVVGEVDEEVDAELDLNGMMAEPLKPVVH